MLCITYRHKCLNNTSKVFLLGGGSWSISFNNNFAHCSSVALVDSVMQHTTVNHCTISYITVLCRNFQGTYILRKTSLKGFCGLSCQVETTDSFED